MSSLAPALNRLRPRRGRPRSFSDALDRARHGDEAGWAMLLEGLAPPALAYLRSRGVRDPEDVFGDVLLELVRGIGRFEGDEAAFRSWVFVVAHSRAVDAIRRRARRPEEPAAEVPEARTGEVGDPEAALLRDLASGEVAPLLEALTEDQRTVLLLRVVAGLSAAEVGDVLGKQPDAVRALQSRALAVLREELSTERVTK